MIFYLSCLCQKVDSINYINTIKGAGLVQEIHENPSSNSLLSFCDPACSRLMSNITETKLFGDTDTSVFQGDCLYCTIRLCSVNITL